jgi:hypothetical protein
MRRLSIFNFSTLILAAVAAFVAAEVFARAGLESVFSLAQKIPGFTGSRIAAGLRPDHTLAVVVIGSSLSGEKDMAHNLAKELQSKSNDGREVLNLAYGNRNFADLFAEMIRVTDYGSDAVYIELNPFLFHDRLNRIGDSKSMVTTEPSRARLILPHLGTEVARTTLWQLGIEGVFEAAIDSTALASFRRTLTGGHRNSSPISGIVRALRAKLILPIHGVAASRPKRVGDVQTRFREGWAIICRNFVTKKPGIDSEILEVMVNWSKTKLRSSVLFIPPMNTRAVVEHCGSEGQAGLKNAIEETQFIAQRSGVAVLNLSQAFADHEEFFMDYGHISVEHLEAAYEILAAQIVNPTQARRHP